MQVPWLRWPSSPSGSENSQAFNSQPWRCVLGAARAVGREGGELMPCHPDLLLLTLPHKAGPRQGVPSSFKWEPPHAFPCLIDALGKHAPNLWAWMRPGVVIQSILLPLGSTGMIPAGQAFVLF